MERERLAHIIHSASVAGILARGKGLGVMGTDVFPCATSPAPDCYVMREG